MTISKEQAVDFLGNLTLLEASQLVKELETKFGVSAAAPVVVQQGPATTLAPVEEQTEFTVKLTAMGEKKIEVIKAIRAITNLGLSEAKAFVESAPKAVKEGITKEEAEKIKATLEAAGAKVELS